jgi:hypothetical protein
MPEPRLLVHIKLPKPSRLRKFQTKCPAISARSIFSLYPKIRKNDRSQKLGKIVVCNWASTLSNIGLEKSADAAIWANNVVKWFTGGGVGKFYLNRREDPRYTETVQWGRVSN